MKTLAAVLLVGTILSGCTENGVSSGGEKLVATVIPYQNTYLRDDLAGRVRMKVIITNRGEKAVRIIDGVVNGQPNCSSTPKKGSELGLGSTLEILYDCGEVVKLTVTTENGEYRWKF